MRPVLAQPARGARQALAARQAVAGEKLAGQRTQDKDRRMIGGQRAQPVHPVAVGKPEVEHKGVIPRHGEKIVSLRETAGRVAAETPPGKPLRQKQRETFIILDDQDPHRAILQHTPCQTRKLDRLADAKLTGVGDN